MQQSARLLAVATASVSGRLLTCKRKYVTSQTTQSCRVSKIPDSQAGSGLYDTCNSV